MTQVRDHRLQQHSIILQLANTIQTIWQNQLVLYPYETPADLGYVEGTLEGERLTIENSCYQTVQFRKLHLELAKVGNNLDILHCVMFPHSHFNLPIFGVDIVAGRDLISAAIVDLSPVSSHALPIEYSECLSRLPLVRFSQPRDLPAWGDIFSDFCLFVRPTTPQEEADFLNRATQYLSLHCRLAREVVPVGSMQEQASIVAGQRHYCLKQQQNDKTRRVLERAFGAEWAERYLQTMLFDSVGATPIRANVMKHEVF
ncbi:MAG: phycocyanobilin:ferredoxin oxidoreductase [Cyanobacteria bacterium P01_A01_bin.114]